MSPYRPPIRDVLFLLRDVFHIDEDWCEFPDLAELDLELVEAILDQSGKLASEIMGPLSRSADEEGASWSDGTVRAPRGFLKAFEQITSGGWLGLSGSPSFGGQGMPKVVSASVEEFFWGANTNLWLYGALTLGATHCLSSHATEKLKARFLPPMYEGRWTGAMALTEPHAGTDLGMLRTSAQPRADGTYSLNGTKIFITSGEHDLAENIIHLVLARLPDAPGGTRGISLFLVPKFLVNEEGSLGARNGFSSTSIEEKMGIHGSATSTIVYEDSVGYLVGEPNRGLACMFTMMNDARLSVGIQGLGLAERAYQLAVDYAKDRLQGRAPHGPTNPEDPADPLIEHPDVRRMLLTQRAYTEGSRAFSIFVAKFLDEAKRHGDAERRARAMRFVDLLTPVAKAFMSDRSLDCTILAQQCFGGHGYIREMGIEQLVRDVRISQIYEGTNGIQALDLVGRKVLQNGGATVMELADYLRETTALDSPQSQVDRSFDIWLDTTRWICEHSSDDVDLAGSVSVDYLDLTGHVIYAWLWARMAAEDTYEFGKQVLAEYYFAKLLPKIDTLASTIREGSDVVMKPSTNWF